MFTITRDSVFLINVFILSFCTFFHNSQGLEFTIEPSDTLVSEGDSILLPCAGKTDKNGNPSIRWRGPDGQEIGIVGDSFRLQLANGSLYISSLVENRGLTGSYQCVLTADGVGTIVSRLARVSISEIPDVNQDSNEIYLYHGQTAYFKCTASPLPIEDKGRYKIIWLKNDSPLQFDATRMQLLPSGALEIDEITTVDRGTYHCNITLGSFSKLSSKSNLNIKSSTGLPESFAAPSFATVPLPQTVREGDTVTLDCVANGNPKPVIKWLKNGEDIDMNDLDSRFRIVGTGSLQIRRVEEGDTGDYQCRAGNNVDSLDASATIQVQVPPKFLERPVNRVASEKEELEFSCSITGTPIPTIHWLKNGDLITQNDYMQIFGGYNLRILGLIPSDAGMFQCIGSNSVGSIQSSAKLQIKEEGNRNSKVLQAKLKSQSKFDGNKLISKSILDSLQSKNKRPGNSLGDYNDDEDGLHYDDDEEEDEDDDDTEEDQILPYGPDVDPKLLLQAHSAKKTKTKDYDNKISHFSNSENNIKINYAGNNDRHSAPLPSAPRDLMAQIVKPRFVTLSWMEPSKNPEEVLTYTIFYKLQQSDRERKLVTKNRDEQEVNIPALLPGKTYQFRVVANSSYGLGESSEILDISTQPEENIAGAPQNLTGFALSHREINLQWLPPLITNGVISKYRVYYAEGENGAEMNSDTSDENIILSDLKPFTVYTISVVPWNQNGMGESSDELVIKTYSAIPSQPPNNVTLEATSSTSIMIRWEPPSEEDRNGQITGYKIRYKKNKKSPQVETTSANARHFELTDLEKMSQYQIKLSAMTVNGSGPYTEWRSISTFENDLDETQMPPAPGWINTRPTGNSIKVSWRPPTQSDIKVRGYVLGWGKGVPDEDTQSFDENIRHYEIPNLESNNEYVISLRATNLIGDGMPVYDTVRTSDELPFDLPTPLEVPVGLRAIPLTGTSIVVHWIDTTLTKNQPAKDNRVYVVKYNPTSSTRVRYYNTTGVDCMIGDLRPNTQYEFAVKVVKGRRESAWSMSVLNSTLQAPPASPPRDLMIKANENNNLNVMLEWQTPKHNSGTIIGYVVLYTTDKNKSDKDWVREEVHGDANRVDIENLQPQTTYYFKLQTRTNRGTGPFSAMVHYTTPMAITFSESSLFNTNDKMIYILVGCLAAVLVAIIVIAIFLCRRKPAPSPEQKSYMKNNAGIKPPDLWIHHDQMELKNLDKNNHTIITTDATSSSGAMTLPRPVVHEYESDSNLTHVTNSLDKRSYVPGYITTPMNSSLERPVYPRTQYNMSRTHVNVEQGQPNMIKTPLPSAENPYVYEAMPPNYASGSYTPEISVDQSKGRPGYGLKSFTVPSTSVSTPINSGQVKANVPAVTIRPQNASPYKKPTMSTSTSNRLQSGPIVAHSSDEIQRLATSTSTEELNQEMANLEGLMKDLSAITANEFEC